MADFFGFIGIFFVTLVTLLITTRWPAVANILYVALTVRIIVLLIGYYVVPLPDSTGDASSFEGEALHMFKTSTGFSNLLSQYPGPGSGFITWIIALLYLFFGESKLMAQSLSLLFGMGSVFLGWLLLRRIWDEHVALKAGWVLALFPSLILYSCLTMREAYISFFLVLALYGVVNWTRVGSFNSVVVAMIGFIGAMFFHGAMFMGAIVFLGIVGLRNFREMFIRPISSPHYLKTLMISLFLIIFFGSYILGKFEIPKLGTFKNIIKIERLLTQTTNSTDGDASYPKWLIIDKPVQLIYKGPIRMVYFVFSPFPWNVKKLSHLLGMIDAFFYIYLVYLIFLNQKTIRLDNALKIILIILFVYILIFGIAVGNFGTGIRHRSKFVLIFILLAAPLLPKFVMLTKDKLYNKKILKTK
jgi:4-amino-4-deoxy-L-arabinose transferase-like glycosyltransferase